jgi:alkaline phosphatase
LRIKSNLNKNKNLLYVFYLSAAIFNNSKVIFMNKIFLILIVLCTLLGSCELVQTKASKELHNSDKCAKNIILFIGDGTGYVHWNIAYYITKQDIAIQNFKNIGIQITSSSDSLITDSGASATAIATGHKTKNSYLSVDENNNRLTTILEIAESKGLSTGLVVTCPITHATPAAFYAHINDRNNHEAIAIDLIHSNIDVFIGGGSDYFNNRSDSMNLIDSLKKRNYNVLFNIDDAENFKSAPLAIFTSPIANPPANEGRGDLLSKATEIAINVLSKNKNGFFLMVEGSQIDWANHQNNKGYLIAELIDFNNAIKKALNFTKNNSETLIIVTGDHESGGVSLIGGDVDNNEYDIVFNSTHHTPMWVPVFAYGHNAELFQGIYQNNLIFNKMIKAFGFDSY